MGNYDNFDFEEFKNKTQEGYLAITTVEEWKGFIKHLAADAGFSPDAYATPNNGILQDGLGVFWNEAICHAQIFPLEETMFHTEHTIKYTMKDFCLVPFTSSEKEVLRFISEV